MNDFFAGLDPDSTLQTHPDIVMSIHARARSRGMMKGQIDLASARPIGPRVAMMMSTGALWTGQSARFGTWKVSTLPDREHLACVVPPEHLILADALEFRVHALSPLVQRPHGPEASDGIAFEGVGPRLTKWSASPSGPPPDAFGDAQRALRLRMEKGQLVMDWYHTARDSVFCEMRERAKSSDEPFMRVVLVKGAAKAGPGWFRADPTPFE